MTVAAFSSLSLHPPLVLVCIERSVRTHEAIAAAGKFAVSILSDAQADISNRFASRNEDKFNGIATHPGVSGVPLIDGAIATLECSVREHLPGGDHSIFVGEVVAIETAEGAPLVYYRSGYRELRF
jgi:flavin reductase (DIM6/NTAB) family NADH-FMN oxidoreductase RutF